MKQVMVRGQFLFPGGSFFAGVFGKSPRLVTNETTEAEAQAEVDRVIGIRFPKGVRCGPGGVAEHGE